MIKAPNLKLQIPGKRQTTILNNQTRSARTFGVWVLGLPWNLGIGIWNFLVIAHIDWRPDSGVIVK